MEKQKYYITTAIAYTSGKPHVSRATTYFSRQEPMNMVRKSN